jgi:hypothetical protein
VTRCLGLGPTVAMYTVVDRVLLRPLPARDARSLVKIETMSRTGGSPLLDIEEWQARSRALQSIAFYYADNNYGHLDFSREGRIDAGRGATCKCAPVSDTRCAYGDGPHLS